MVLNRECDSDESWLALFPDQRLEEMIAANLDIRRNLSGCAAAENYVLSGGFQEVVDYFVCAHNRRSVAAGDGLRIGAPAQADAVEISKRRVDDRHVTAAVQLHPASGFVTGIAMEPHPVENDVVEGRTDRGRGQRIDVSARCLLRDLKPDEAVVVGAILKHQRPGIGAVEFDL